MLGEKRQELRINQLGAEGDRLFGLKENATHKFVTARQQPDLLAHRAAFAGEKVQVTLPDGRTMDAEDSRLIDYFEQRYGRKVSLARAFDERHPKGIFDDDSILLISTQSLAELERRYAGSFDVRRFRANIWIDGPEKEPFFEEAWLNKEIAIGSEVVLKADTLCERCVMTTHAQEELPQDHGILKTIVQTNNAVLGVYCKIVQGGLIRLGDNVHRND